MRVTVLDCGSNSFCVLVAEVTADGVVRHVLRERAFLRLGQVVARHGRIPARELGDAARTVARLCARARPAGSEDLRAVATGAVRTAANRAAVLACLSEAAGTRVRLLDGRDEAALSYRGMRASVALPPGPVLALDLGGGSLEVVVGDGTRVLAAVSLPIGTARLAGELDGHDPLTPQRAARVRQVVADRLAGLAGRDLPGTCVAAGGALRALARLTALRRWGSWPPSLNQMRLGAGELRDLQAAMLGTTTAQRRAMPGMKARRADLGGVGAVIAATVVDELGLDGLLLSEWGLREGLALDAAGVPPAPGPDAVRESAVRRLLAAFQADACPAERAAAEAAALFDRSVGAHGLGPADRELLRTAALLHGIGRSVALRRHHRHGAYLVEQAGLRGFAPEEVATLATLVRYQRGGVPAPSFAPYARVPAGRREAVAALTALLQAALGHPQAAALRFGPVVSRAAATGLVSAPPAAASRP